MEPIIVNGKEYYPVKVVAKLWHLNEATIRKYASERVGKIPGAIKQDGIWLIPANAVKPINEPIAQGLIWSILELKNETNGFLDLTKFDIDNHQLESVLLELERQQYLILEPDVADVRKRLLSARVSSKGFALVRYKKKLKQNPFTEGIGIEAVIHCLQFVQTAAQIISLIKS